MNHWIVFDEPTADAVRTVSEGEPEIRRAAEANLLATILEAPRAVALLPADAFGNVLVIHARRQEPGQSQKPTPSQRNLAPAGFLGLSDSIDMDSEPEPPKKWWRKITG